MAAGNEGTCKWIGHVQEESIDKLKQDKITCDPESLKASLESKMDLYEEDFEDGERLYNVTSTILIDIQNVYNQYIYEYDVQSIEAVDYPYEFNP